MFKERVMNQDILPCIYGRRGNKRHLIGLMLFKIQMGNLLMNS